MDKINPRYIELLSKFSGNKELKELLDLVSLDLIRMDEIFYGRNNCYPKKRDGLGKLKYDLSIREKGIKAGH